MSGLPSFMPYKKGVSEDLDKKWGKYRRMLIWAGDAWREALSKKEEDDLLEIQKIKRLKPRALTFGEVAAYVELAEKIYDYRYRVKVERGRLRKAKSRKKVKAAAKQADQSIVIESETIKSNTKTHFSEEKERE